MSGLGVSFLPSDVYGSSLNAPDRGEAKVADTEMFLSKTKP